MQRRGRWLWEHTRTPAVGACCLSKGTASWSAGPRREVLTACHTSPPPAPTLRFAAGRYQAQSWSCLTSAGGGRRNWRFGPQAQRGGGGRGPGWHRSSRDTPSQRAAQPRSSVFWMNQGLKVSKQPGNVVMSHPAFLMVAVQINPWTTLNITRKVWNSESSQGFLYFPQELIVRREFQIKKPHFASTSYVSRVQDLTHTLL